VLLRALRRWPSGIGSLTLRAARSRARIKTRERWTDGS